MKWIRKIFTNRSTQLQVSKNELLGGIFIPEPTRSLLWITEEDPSKIKSALSIEINVTLGESGVEIKNESNSGNLFSEPSLIWKRLPVLKNDDLPDGPMYYPSYANLSPACRYQYVKWLANIDQQTNLSYVFLYYYGLERHLLIGDFDKAVHEVIRLINKHDRGTFRAYATSALLMASVLRNRPDIIGMAPFLKKELTNEALILRRQINQSLTVDEIMELVSSSGFKNRTYINKFPELFKSVLSETVAKFEEEKGSLLSTVSLESLKREATITFANYSIPEKLRTITVPQLLRSQEFKDTLNSLFSDTHARVKEIVSQNRKSQSK